MLMLAQADKQQLARVVADIHKTNQALQAQHMQMGQLQHQRDDLQVFCCNQLFLFT